MSRTHSSSALLFLFLTLTYLITAAVLPAAGTSRNKHLEPATSDADPDVLVCGPLTMTHIDAYQFWYHRLLRLKQLFDQVKLRTLRLWWNDRRKGTQWYALWVAVGFTVFFGLVQSIKGALQVYKAYHPE